MSSNGEKASDWKGPVFLLLMSVGCIIFALVDFSNVPSGGSESDVPVLNRAENVTETMLLETLKSPTTAQFSGFRIIDSSPPYYQTAIIVDSQNGFGAIIRNFFLCAFKLEGDRKFTHSRMNGVIKISDYRRLPGDQFNREFDLLLDQQKAIIEWPGYGE